MKSMKVRDARGGAIRRAVISYLCAALTVSAFGSGELAGSLGADPVVAAAVFAASFAALSAAPIKLPRAERASIPILFALLSASFLIGSFSWYTLSASAAVLIVLTVYAQKGRAANNCETDSRAQKSVTAQTAPIAAAAAIGVLLFAFAAWWGIARIRSFSSPAFDMGIFSQMMESMRATGTPMTTLERDGALSHMRVHLSPIWYAMLPFYAIFPHAETMAALGAAVAASAAFPMWKLCRAHGIGGVGALLITSSAMLTPTFFGALGYDVHENIFLLPLLLWLLYGLDRKNAVITAASFVLMLAVKEDAAVYTFAVGAYAAMSAYFDAPDNAARRRGVAIGAVVAALSVVYFVLAVNFLENRGDGILIYHYSNFAGGGRSPIINIVAAALLYPMRILSECAEADKLGFIAATMLPAAGLPFLTRRYERFALLIPYALLNLVTDYAYQHNVLYQYTSGSTALIIYLCIVNAAELHAPTRRTIAAAMLALSVLAFSYTVLPEGIKYISRECVYREYYNERRAALCEIPDGAPASSTTFLTVYLSKRQTLYDIQYCSTEHLLASDYVAFEEKAEKELQKYGGIDGFVRFLTDHGYVRAGGGGGVVIYARADIEADA